MLQGRLLLQLAAVCGGLAGNTLADDHWAFHSPQNPDLPSEASEPWARNAIDAFVLRKLQESDGRMSPSAAEETARLLRRLSLDLRGLPVSPEEQDAILSADHPLALERAIDRWLASPHYGERRAQDWLDLARYADTTGHAADQPRTMWLFRDWVVHALNADMPFDRFTIEQLAGDRLPGADEAQRIASGFHRNAMQALGNNPRKEEFRVRGIVDRLDVTGQVWLGLSLACAECHDHKHDPISQKDYYRLFAIFNQVPHHGERFEVHGPRLTVDRFIDGTLQEVEAQVMDTLEMPRETAIHLRGNFEQRGPLVGPGVPAFLLSPQSSVEAPKDRLGFARWLVSGEHPLTARVTVNRAWQRFFGRGLVATLNDFGLNGEAPSHPELLDWLTLRFQRDGAWSLKRLHRDFLTSATYRQTSALEERARLADPENRLLARAAKPRLPAEVLRDQALAIGGLLVHQSGGPSVFPPQPPGVGQFRDATAGSWSVSTGRDAYRRSLYTFWQRMAPHPAMTTFDAPSREWCTVERTLSNTPLQALAMLNDPAMAEARDGFVRRLTRSSGDKAARLERAFRETLSRPPSAAERTRWLEVLDARPEEGLAILATVLFNLDEFLTRP